jgi:hypothetical protein
MRETLLILLIITFSSVSCTIIDGYNSVNVIDGKTSIALCKLPNETVIEHYSGYSLVFKLGCFLGGKYDT